MSIVFDRAVDYYDQTRALPEWRHRAIIDALVRETGITQDSRVLEIGIGTGRIGISIAEHVRRLFGVDLSVEMMNKLRLKLANTNLKIDIAQANARHLPFASNTFDVVYAVHVYHLVENWRNAIRDAQRVLKPGGKFVVSFHKRDPHSPNTLLRRRMRELANEYGVDTRRPGAQSEEEIYAEILKWDAAPRIVQTSVWQETENVSEILEEIDRQIFSETWMIPRAVMDQIKPRLCKWAQEKFGDPAPPLQTRYDSRWLIAAKA
ncbi:MAG: methyltransferase domain-containing protein [Chloroflexi bacterium]|nr:methyltransferase domain-containing protein [Chloroflexota bacterium]